MPEVKDSELRWLYANCSMVVAASFEDFGLTPVEAAHGASRVQRFAPGLPPRHRERRVER
ncbi:MAG: hypothetical protein M5U19_00635 [Microthrixaceae bacterium]|nr:hypothetical protein [Microthrixaceae bacterium]